MLSSKSKKISAVLDACVLAPMPLCDTLLRCAEEPSLFLPLWSEETLLEVRRTLKKFGRSESQIERRVNFMEASFPEACVYVRMELLNAVPDIPDHGDWHVIAAAIQGEADLIVTFNLRHFPSSVLKPKGIEVCSPDAFLVDLFHANPQRLLEILNTQAQHIRQSTSAMLERLGAGLPEFVALFGGQRG
jgi:predicted nucleic acid-binding protein